MLLWRPLRPRIPINIETRDFGIGRTMLPQIHATPASTHTLQDSSHCLLFALYRGKRYAPAAPFYSSRLLFSQRKFYSTGAFPTDVPEPAASELDLSDSSSDEETEHKERAISERNRNGVSAKVAFASANATKALTPFQCVQEIIDVVLVSNLNIETSSHVQSGIFIISLLHDTSTVFVNRCLGKTHRFLSG